MFLHKNEVFVEGNLIKSTKPQRINFESTEKQTLVSLIPVQRLNYAKYEPQILVHKVRISNLMGGYKPQIYSPITVINHFLLLSLPLRFTHHHKLKEAAREMCFDHNYFPILQPINYKLVGPYLLCLM